VGVRAALEPVAAGRHLGLQSHRGTESHPCELYLSLGDIEHRTTRVRSPQTGGFVERFNRTALDEFFRPVFRRRFYESVEALQKDLDKWLHQYNHERPHQGYRNVGARPIDTVLRFAKKRTRKVSAKKSS